MLQNPMYDSGVLGYRCIIANKLGDRQAFDRYFERYDSIHQHLPEQFNATNLQQVMVCHYLMQKDYQQALAWCDSVYEQMGDWKQAFLASELKDSLMLISEREALEMHTMDMQHDIDQLQNEQRKAKIRHIQLLIVGLMALAIIGLLVGMLIFRHQKNRRLKEQFLQLQEARRRTEAGQVIRRAFVTSIQQKLRPSINLLRGYARAFNNPEFRMKPETRPKRYNDILNAARNIESRAPLFTLISTSEVIIDGKGEIPSDEYMQLRASVCRDAYHVSVSTHQLILFSLYGDDFPTPKPDRVALNEMARSILNSYDLQPSAIDKNRVLATEFTTEVADDVMVDTNSLLQELLNCLLDNANKYATGGSVLMSCHANVDGTYAISVSNEGPTISADDAERIFEPFVRLSASEQSLGIGLPLARRLAISMGYTVTLDTEYTKGARFIVSGI